MGEEFLQELRRLSDAATEFVATVATMNAQMRSAAQEGKWSVDFDLRGWDIRRISEHYTKQKFGVQQILGGDGIKISWDNQ